MHALTFVIISLLVFALAYRFYAKFIITKVLVLDSRRPTPAHTLRDGKDYHPTNKFVLFGRTAGRPGPGGAIWIPAGFFVDSHRSGAGRRGS